MTIRTLLPSLALLSTLALAAGCAGQIHQAELQVLAQPAAASSWIALGDAYQRAMKRKDALAAYEQALRFDPDNPVAQQAIQSLAPARSVSKLERKALKHPGDDEIWGDLGDELARRGQTDKALQAYQYALRLDPTDNEWISAMVQLGAEDAVLEALQQRVQAQPQDDEAMGDYADILRSLGRHEESCLAYQRARQLDPTDSEWIDAVSRCSMGAVPLEGEPPDALSLDAEMGMLEAQLSQDPNNDELLGAMGRRLTDAGDTKRALEQYRRALDRDPSDQEWLMMVVLLSGEPKLLVLERLAALHPQNDEVWGNLGDHHLELGQTEQAIEAFRKALDLDPSDEEWQAKLRLITSR